ncbi:MAG: cation:dicarboxylate symporter family transporter [Eubacterium ramulus]
MKKFYAWYQKHITGAIFIGLLLGILTGLFLADRFAPVLTVTSLLGGIYMNALNMMIFPLVFCSSSLVAESAASGIKTTGKIAGGFRYYFPLCSCTRRPCRSDHPTATIHLRKRCFLRDGSIRNIAALRYDMEGYRKPSNA